MRVVMFFLLTMLALVGSAAAQVVCSLGTGAGRYIPQADTPPSERALREGRHLHRLMCNDCGSIMLVQNQTVANASLMSVRPGVSKLSYSAAFFGQILRKYGPGATIGIIAHEIGHHVDFMQPAAWFDRSWGKELRADAWAGCGLARAGISPNQLNNALRAIAAFPSQSHPPWPQRQQAVMTGFRNCSTRR